MAKLLVVEDDASIRSGLRDALISDGHEVIEAEDGAQGLHLGLTADPDLIVLDLMMPGMDGFEVLERLRRDSVETPVLVLTARGLEADKLRGFALGADDYIVKPFGIAELLARIASRLRTWDRERGIATREALRFGGVTVDFVNRTVHQQDGIVTLSPKEFDLLACLAAHEGRTLSRTKILELVWADDSEVVSRVIDTAILNLRKKVEVDPAAPRHIVTVRGIGYRFSRAP